jgi:hypothetical protein
MASVACNPQNLQNEDSLRTNRACQQSPLKVGNASLDFILTKNIYKAASDAKEVPPEITRQLGAWAPVAGDTPYSRMNEAQINKNRKRIVNSNDKFLEITW